MHIDSSPSLTITNPNTSNTSFPFKHRSKKTEDKGVDLGL